MDSACFASAIKIIVLLLSQLAVILLNPQTLTTVSDTLHRKRFQSVFNCKTTIPILAGYVLVQDLQNLQAYTLEHSHQKLRIKTLMTSVYLAGQTHSSIKFKTPRLFIKVWSVLFLHYSCCFNSVYCSCNRG